MTLFYTALLHREILFYCNLIFFSIIFHLIRNCSDGRQNKEKYIEKRTNKSHKLYNFAFITA
jgi:hypothetical protein